MMYITNLFIKINNRGKIFGEEGIRNKDFTLCKYEGE